MARQLTERCLLVPERLGEPVGVSPEEGVAADNAARAGDDHAPLELLKVVRAVPFQSRGQERRAEVLDARLDSRKAPQGHCQQP